MNNNETWLNMDESPYYQISSQGRIKILSHSYTNHGVEVQCNEMIKEPNTQGKISIKQHPYDIRTLMLKYFPNEYISKFKQETTLENEEWKDVPGLEGMYQVSSLGRARSLPRKGEEITIDRTRHGKQESYTIIKNSSLGKLLKAHKACKPDREGFYRQQFIFMVNGKPKSYNVSRLVANVFIPNPYNLQEVNHKNRDINDCSVANLEWVSKEDNINHAFLKRSTLIPFYQLAYDENLSPDDMLSKLVSFYLHHK